MVAPTPAALQPLVTQRFLQKRSLRCGKVWSLTQMTLILTTTWISTTMTVHSWQIKRVARL